MLEDGVVEGRIFLMPIGPRGDRRCGRAATMGAIERPAHGYKPTREAALAALALARPPRMGAATGSNVRNSFCPDNCPGSRRNRDHSLERSLITLEKDWSEWQDLNLRPPRPERGVPPG